MIADPADVVADRRPVLLMGPTASGKSALAMALAERLDLEIVSVDSAQVYRGMDVGTAKPGREERSRVAHHLLDVVDPTEAYSAARFVGDALAAIDAVRARGRVPLLVGGTMLYFRALRDGLSELPAASASVRAAIEREALDLGWPAMHARLAAVDRASAARLEPTDAQRIQRALEVFAVTGRPLSALLARARPQASLGAHAAIALVPSDRGELHRRIDRRFAQMLEAGLIDELAGLRRRFALDPRMPSMRAVGYRQAWAYLEGDIGKAELVARGQAATRQLAKRQLTWLRQTPARVFDCLAGDLAAAVSRHLGR